MYTRFPDLRLCDGHWKAEYIATKLYGGAWDYYFKSQARIKIKQEAAEKARVDVQDAAGALAKRVEFIIINPLQQGKSSTQSEDITPAGRVAASNTSTTTTPVAPAPPVPAFPVPALPAPSPPTPPVPAFLAPSPPVPAPAPPTPAVPAPARMPTPTPATTPMPGSTPTTTSTLTPTPGATSLLVAPPPRLKRPSQLKKPSLTSKDPKNLFAEVWCDEKLGKGRVDEFNEAWANLDTAKKEEYKALSKLIKNGGHLKGDK
ncbi:hypothetical protein BOTBODRAFT_45146 [Botryobasidium botryosum FD-172 SS1]|uniref:Uncharacterized protein n=1 Tax=Botryobasidium botryosum (strain FD-172 SS1) TaxID=930990 RepID=A0A067MPC3_BOTB1|nr:hypothetical protein BOTBODRAFT_45146 [Botryobasidium botryosum FD-172 SS1]